MTQVTISSGQKAGFPAGGKYQFALPLPLQFRIIPLNGDYRNITKSAKPPALEPVLRPAGQGHWERNWRVCRPCCQIC